MSDTQGTTVLRRMPRRQIRKSANPRSKNALWDMSAHLHANPQVSEHAVSVGLMGLAWGAWWDSARGVFVVTAKVETLARNARIKSPTTVRKALAELRDAGIIRIHGNWRAKAPGVTHRTANTYDILPAAAVSIPSSRDAMDAATAASVPPYRHDVTEPRSPRGDGHSPTSSLEDLNRSDQISSKDRETDDGSEKRWITVDEVRTILGPELAGKWSQYLAGNCRRDLKALATRDPEDVRRVVKAFATGSSRVAKFARDGKPGDENGPGPIWALGKGFDRILGEPDIAPPPPVRYKTAQELLRETFEREDGERAA
jgi:hypothetical protein